ncbi:MAG: catalase [Clostridia bacterium]|nr:catalase [Clostridia bacterium]
MSLKGAFRHFHTITKHRHRVIAHCFRAGIPWRGLMHDLSKYTPTEFGEGARCYQGTRSPNEKAREEKGHSAAWLHHQGRNRHHFEYWFDYNPKTHQREPVKMPLIFVVEMFCDRVAASKIYQGKAYTEEHPLQYFLRAKPTRVIHPDTSDLLESWLVMLKEKGEKETFRYLRKLKKRNAKYGKEDC